MRSRRLLLAGLAAVCSFAPVAAHAGRVLAPHRAVYDIELNQASDRSGITGITGRMVYEFDGSACEGYVVNFRFVTQVDTSENSSISDLQTSTYEDASGDHFSFVTKFYIDRELDREIKGEATRSGDTIEVQLDKPDARNVQLQRTQFPTEHLQELIEKALSSETFYETTLFDGSEDADRIMTTTVVIGDKEPVDANDPEKAAMASLADDRFWPVDIAYFDLSKAEELPSYRISFKLHENGVTHDILMDYGDYSMKGELVDLALYEAEAGGCDQQ
ncbi:MAG: cell envelope integrity EipB family protein [Rhizobiaceae bacterium]|nr:cell envelope integrity EipB family protein [Rhizobiaceae bacterium]